MTRRFRKLWLVSFGAAAIAAVSPYGAGQSSTPSEGPQNAGVVSPATTGILGQRDGEALKEIIAHLTAVGAALWTGMQGTGQIVYGAGDQTAYPATLSLVGADRFRLDAQTDRGSMSIRIQGQTGKVQEGDGRMFYLPTDTAALGMVQFELPRLADFPASTASLFSKDPAMVDGVALHRVAYEFSSFGKAVGKTVTTDLYFDPVSHLLVKTATSILLEGTHNNRLLQVVSYGDYRKVGSSLVPFLYTQTLDGRLQWTLQLTAIQLNPALDGTFFQF